MNHSLPISRAARRVALVTAAVVATASCAISTQQEVQLGTTYAAQIDTQLPIIRDAQSVNYVNTLGNALAAVTDTRGLTWHFTIVDTKEVNAFAVPGGWVYVNRGLVARAQTMDQLAGVIAHEIGHVTLRHTVQQMQQSDQVNGGLLALCTLTKVCDSGAAQTAINLGGTALFAKFSRQDESEADAEAVKTTVKAGIDPNGIPAMFRILLAERQTNPTAVDAFFATHPLEEARITATEQQIAAYPASQLRNLRVDDNAFQQFKRRLASLPPSPAPKPAASTGSND
ncbi:MAG TPA: M48 family metallopeptidase [Gemmatimonadaceae bacterium]|nr:M48 family metallopeptidase [Gemmatimonadaceae bacterium]